jgi:hypothetical protein
MIAGTIGALFSLIYAIVWIASIIWAYMDARNRDKSGCLVALLVIILPWPIGLIVWLLLRPERSF